MRKVVYLFKTSSRFINSLTSIVQRGEVVGASSVGSGFDSPTVISCLGIVRRAGVVIGTAGRRSAASDDFSLLGLKRPREQPVRAMKSSRSASSAPPSTSARSARWRAASTNCGSFSVDQRLQRRIRPFAAHGADLAGGRVEDLHRGRRRRPASRTCTGCADRASRRCRACNRACCCRAWPRLPRRRPADTA